VIHDRIPFADYLVGEAGIALTVETSGTPERGFGVSVLAGAAFCLAGACLIMLELATRLRD
jgi:hypothetical protein